MAAYNLFKEEIDISFDEFCQISREYTEEYGTNYKGFLVNNNISKDLINKIDDICGDLKPFFTDTSESVKMLEKIPVRVFCFTNCNKKQSEYMLATLGLDKYVDTLFVPSYKPDSEIICKPMLEAFNIVNKIVNKKGNKKILFFDDNIKNVDGAKKAGWIGIHVKDSDKISEIVNKEMKEHFNMELN
jgi:FMN phosphatase YigB (HAD superfamily)